MSRVAVALVILGLSLGLAGVTAGSAFAYSGGPDTAITQAIHKEQVKAYIRSTGYVPISNTANVRTGLATARVAAGVMPAAVAASGSYVVLGATAITIAYKVGTAIGGSEYLYEKLTGNEVYTAAPGTFLPPRIWFETDCSSVSIYYELPAAPCAMLRGQGNPYEIQAWGGSGYWSPSVSDAPALQTHGETYGYQHGDRTNGCTTHTANSCAHVLYKSKSSFQKSFTAEPMTAAEYNAFTAGGTNLKPAVATMPETTTDAELNAALEELGATNGTTGTAVQEQTIADINARLEPAPTELQMPKPNVNETYTAYIGRLQALGYTGTITNTELSPALEGYGPGSPARVLIPGATAGTITTLDPLAWPSPNPNLLSDAAITLRRNPTTAPEVPTTGGQTGPEGEVPAIDWSPLNVGLGSKFPFGAFDWISTLFGSFTQANELPCWTISRPPGLPAGDGYTVCVPANDYRGYSDPIMKLIVIVASIWFAGTWIVGWSRGETMDGGG